MKLSFWKKNKNIHNSETAKIRGSLDKFCKGNGLDIGYGGDPIVPTAICLDIADRCARDKDHPQNLYGDAGNLYWFQDNCLDYVYSSHALEDFKNTEAVLDEWFRVVKPGGVLVLYLPDEQVYREYCRKNGKPRNDHHVHENFSLNLIKNISKKRKSVEIVHEKSPSGIYSFELVLRKTKP